MKASVIIAIYKDIEALDLIIRSLINQTYKDEYEIIIAEDGSDPKVKAFIKTLPYHNILHTTQEDYGWQKNRSLNNAIKITRGQLLIFLDGDCIPYSNFLENYIQYSETKTVLCGRRVELGEKYSEKLRAKTISALEIENNYFKLYFDLMKDNTRHYEEGIKLINFFYNLKYKNKTSHILGCNFAVNRDDIIGINGFNEDYSTPSVGEDTDIEYRLMKLGCTIKPIRNRANIFHIYHKNTYNQDNHTTSMKVFTNIKQNNEYICKNGIQKLD